MATNKSFGRSCSLFVKRTADIVCSIILMSVLLLPCAVIAVIVRLDTHASPLFRQERLGRNGKVFRIFKFRTMTANAPKDVSTFRLREAERYITKFGRVLRRTSLDEIPQLLNIFTGSMSFIGPRPLIVDEEVNRRRMEVGALRVRPGMTGWAQVHGRDRVTIDQKVAYDAYYADHLSVWLDIKIIIRTIVCLFTTKDIVEGENRAITKSQTVILNEDGEERKSENE